MSQRNVLREVALAAVLLVLAAIACGPTGGGGGAPSTTITAPSSGAAVRVGEEVQIVSTAAADKGIDHVELLVNGQRVRSVAPPEGNPTTFAVSIPWTPVAEGEVTVSVIAYDTDGQASEPATIILRVEEAMAEITPTPEPDVEGPGGCSLNAAFVADVTVPDNTEFAPGESFVKTWRVRNTGTCDWGPGFKLVFISGDAMGGPASVDVPPTAAGSTADISVNLTAPNTPGTYRGDWRLQSDTGLLFGTKVFVQIVVPEPTEEPTEEITPSPPTNLQANFQPDGTVQFTWDDATGEAEYRYEFAFTPGSGMPVATSSSLPADTTSWSPGVLGCGGNGSFTIIALTGDGSEIGRLTVNFNTPACETETVTLSPVGSLTGNLSEAGCSSSIRAGIAPAGNGIRAVVSFDIEDLNDASRVVSVRLDLSEYSMDGDPFDLLHSLHVDQVEYTGRCAYPTAYSGGFIASLAEISDAVPGLDNPIDVTDALSNHLASGTPQYFQIRLWFDNDDAGSAFASMTEWSTVRLMVEYEP
ncbi:MAG TPA: hypothetical protein EYH27_04695 [Anaerolineales bacterium]|nr:hypothetical protein [Anaerolineae bacterium]HIP87719.1 hypothetical protein [Anaerolineales bacterium]